MNITIGSSERIVQTPVPLTYARHTSRFLSMFCLTAPIALVGELGAYVVPFVGIIAWSLFGIQEIGKLIVMISEAVSSFVSLFVASIIFFVLFHTYAFSAWSIFYIWKIVFGLCCVILSK
jgi:hypothetical protein